jgi:hypothetical protein
MAAVVLPAAGFQYDHVTGLVAVPNAHLFNTYFGMCGVNNPGGTKDYSIQVVQMLAFSLGKRDINNQHDLDAVLYGIHGVTEAAILLNIATAINNGFTHNITPANSALETAFKIIRVAQRWAISNPNRLRVMVVGDFYPLPAMAGGANPPRVRLSYSLLSDTGTLSLIPVAEVIGLSGYIHDAASRNNQSKYAIFFDSVVDFLNQPPIANQPAAVARAIVQSGLPPQLAAYPINLGEQYSHLLLRLHYMSGTYADRRIAFATYSMLLINMSSLLQDFLSPALTEGQRTEAYETMALAIYDSQTAPSAATLFHYGTAMNVARQLGLMPEIILRANQMAPLPDASWRAAEAVAEFNRRRAVVVNAGAGGTQGNSSDPNATAAVNASRTLIQQLVTSLMALPFFGPASADILRFHAANPSNEFPIIKRALESRNVIFFQVAMGKLRGVSNAAPALNILEGASASFLKFVDYTTVMNKAPAANPGLRPPHSLTFNKEEFTKIFISNNRDKFMKLNILDLCNDIKSTREHILKQPLVRGTFSILESSDNFIILKYFADYLDAFEFKHTGPGSWIDALEKLQTFQQNGFSMPGLSREFHFKNCQAAYEILLGELFDALSHFTQNREASNIAKALSDRVFEMNGAFEQHLQFQNTTTQSLNNFVLLNPAFAAVLSGPGGKRPSPGAGPSSPESSSPGSKNKIKHQWQTGQLLHFGKGNHKVSYNTKLQLVELIKVDPSIKPGQFCFVDYLSKSDACNNPKHKSSSWHKYSPAVQALRETFEHKPFRFDDKAKPQK